MVSRPGLLRGKQASLLAVALLVIFSSVSWAAGPAKVVVEDKSSKTINVGVGKSVIIRSSTPISQATVANPEVADVVELLSPTQIYITGKSPGLTTLTLWSGQEKIHAIYDIEVTPDLSRLKQKLHQVVPSEQGLKVVAANDAITITGKASSTAALGQVVALAEAYSGGKKVINMAEVSGVQQVMLEVKVAEMSRSVGKRLGVNFAIGKDGSIGASLLGSLTPVNSFTGGNNGSKLDLDISPTVNALFHIISGNSTWTAFIDALQEDGLVKILAEPSLITLSGQPASFLAGGEFPVPVSQGDNGIGIEYKDFGVMLSFTPTVLSDRKINLVVTPEVSDLDYSTAVTLSGVAVPGLSKRRVSTVIELGDGQSFAVAGLLRENVRESISKFPILGNLPVLGPLFRSSSFQKNETELVVIVTPHLVKPIDGARQPLPTDFFIEPTDCEFFLKGVMQGREAAPPAAPMALGRRGGLEGEFGHTMP